MFGLLLSYLFVVVFVFSLTQNISSIVTLLLVFFVNYLLILFYIHVLKTLDQWLYCYRMYFFLFYYFKKEKKNVKAMVTLLLGSSTKMTSFQLM